MTVAEQASLDRLADRMEQRFDKLDSLMESRRVEEVRVRDALAERIETVDARVDEYDKAKTVAEAFFSFGRWVTGAAIVVLTLVFAYMSTNGYH